jgi:hypothetical protein
MIEQHLYISTGHITPETLILVDTSSFESRVESGWPNMTVAPYDCGTFVTVPDEITSRQEQSIPADLLGVLNFARAQGASVVRLDQSADFVPGLPEYEGKLFFTSPDVESSEAEVPLDKESTIARMKKEVLEDMAAGRVPVSVKNFGDLHSHVDANYYGGFCDDKIADQLEKFYGQDNYVSFMNECQEAVHEWLEGGRSTTPEGNPVVMHRVTLVTPDLSDLIPFLDEFDVTLECTSQAASCATFVGREECLRAMHAEHWNEEYPGSDPV